MGWQDAGIAWSARAQDWAEFMEPHFRPVYEALATGVPVGPGMQVLDVGCGAGLGLSVYSAHGAECAGVDAGQGLLDIAQARVPEADLRHGSMVDLPWPDATFDAVVGVNAFAYSDDGALAEAHRVLRPGGTLGIGFWDSPGDFAWPMTALGAALEAYVSHDQVATPLRMADPQVRLAALTATGFAQRSTGRVDAVTTFADAPTAYRALASTGMIQPLVRAGAEDELRTSTLAWLGQRPEPRHRFHASFGWVTATRQ
jgi:SAM-dependent methyltransferase